MSNGTRCVHVTSIYRAPVYQAFYEMVWEEGGVYEKPTKQKTGPDVDVYSVATQDSSGGS